MCFFFSFLVFIHNDTMQKKKSAQLREFFTSCSCGIWDILRRAACPSNSSEAITVVDSVYSLQEMSLKTDKDKLHLFVPIIKREKVEAVGDTKVHSYWKYISPLVLRPLRQKKIKTYIMPYRGFCFCSSRKTTLSTLIDMQLWKSGKRKSFAAVY